MIDVPLMPKNKHMCPSCMEGKHSRKGVVHVKTTKCQYATTPLELVHLDICGMIHLASKFSIMIPSMVFIKLFHFVHK
jgi:hypothetical protein